MSTDQGLSENENLLVRILEWFKVEIARCEYENAEYPAATRVTKWLFHAHSSRDISAIAASFDRAADAVRAEDGQRLLDELGEARALVDGLGISDELDVKKYLDLLERLQDVLKESSKDSWLGGDLESLWFEIAHAWRSEPRRNNYRALNDLTKFGPLQLIISLILIVPGLILETVNSPGIYKLVPAIYMGSACTAMGIAMSTRKALWKLLFLFWVVLYLGAIPSRYLRPEMGGWASWPWTSGCIIGIFIGCDVSYRRAQRMTSQYGPFAQLWARHVHGHVFELMMVTSEGRLAWYYQISNWWRQVDACLGGDISFDLRGDVRMKGWESKPYGGWFVCYPGLVATHTMGLASHSARTWSEAKAWTEGLTPLMVGRFFANPPSLVAPPAAFVALGPTVLPPFRTIPDWGRRGARDATNQLEPMPSW